MDIEKEICDIKETLAEHSKILVRMESVLVSNPSVGTKGIGERVTDLEKANEVYKKKVWFITGAVTAAMLSLQGLIKEYWHKIF